MSERCYGISIFLTPADEESIGRMKQSAEGRAVQLTGTFEPTDEAFPLLALGFSKAEPGSLTVPYARLD